MANSEQPVAEHVSERATRIAAIRAMLNTERDHCLATINRLEKELRETNAQRKEIDELLRKGPGDA